MGTTVHDPHPESELAEVSILHTNSVVPGVLQELAIVHNSLFCCRLLLKLQVVNGVPNNRYTSEHDVEELKDDGFKQNLS